MKLADTVVWTIWHWHGMRLVILGPRFNHHQVLTKPEIVPLERIQLAMLCSPSVTTFRHALTSPDLYIVNGH